MNKIMKTTKDNSMNKDNSTMDIHDKCAILEQQVEVRQAILDWYEE